MDQSDAGSAGIFSRWTNMQTGTSASGRKAGTTGRARHGHTASVSTANFTGRGVHLVNVGHAPARGGVGRRRRTLPAEKMAEERSESELESEEVRAC
eukprot:3938342-Pyramimonas_sp.AAC.2